MNLHGFVSLGFLALSLASCRDGGDSRVSAAFYAAPADAGEKLPADGIFPRGRKLAFMGYSGDPARDLANGFSVAGLVYGDQTSYLKQCAEKNWPVAAHIGARITFNDKAPDKYKVDEPALRAEIARQTQALAPQRNIIWWAVHPEELRPWRGDEMRYLEIVTSEIRANDPEKRPVFLYNPNNRDAGSLAPIAKHVDVIAKGSYVNSAGKKRERAWVRWGIEQEVAAIEKAGRPGAFPLLMPELCADPPAGEETEIRAWVRHDIYLGMAAGAKGVNIWSLFKRKEVKKTWQLWYDAYTECARELNGDRKVAQVFLFGEKRDDIHVENRKSPAKTGIELGGDAEPETSSPEESAKRRVDFASWTKAEFAYGNSRYVFLIHSGNEPATFTLSGWPTGSRAENAFNGEIVPLTGASLTVELPAYGVMAWRFSTK